MKSGAEALLFVIDIRLHSIVHKIAEDKLFDTVANGVHSARPFKVIGGFEIFGDAFDLGVLAHQQVVSLLCVSIHIRQILFERAFHPHHIDDRREVIFQIVVVALSPYADAGNKFIFHNKILLCKYIVPQRRYIEKCAFQNNCKKPGSIG